MAKVRNDSSGPLSSVPGPNQVPGNAQPATRSGVALRRMLHYEAPFLGSRSQQAWM